jgi:gamma-glutamylcyclotransferase (GGCT)/AIG2-like uncharacterized protein YtfP
VPTAKIQNTSPSALSKDLHNDGNGSKETNPEKDAIDKLFVYGSLKSDHNLQLVTGRILPSKSAILFDHRKISPRNGFPFAVSWRGSKIEGRLLYDITPAILTRLDEYESEGELYHREIAQVLVGEDIVSAYIYIGNAIALRHYFEKGYEEKDRIEEFVERSVDRYLQEKADRCLPVDREQLPIRVARELLSEEIHGLLRQYFHDAGFPPFIIKHEIERASIPDLSWVSTDANALKYFESYMTLATKFMIFNQLEERFRNEYRVQVKVADAYYMHAISAMMALKLLVNHAQQLKSALAQLGINRYNRTLEYIDYAVAAIFIAEELYTKERADEIADWIKSNRHSGISPLGAELEFSNLGVRAIKAAADEDPVYDSFFYFYQFDLMRRGWKLGAHVDDHGFLTSTDVHTRGFLELAFGRYKLFGDVSKPATQDPWILSQIIDLATRFVEVRPHSLHISIEIAPEASFKKLEDPEYFLCLLLLGGDLREDQYGKLREMRIFRGEILHPDVGVCLSRLNRHRQDPDESKWSTVVEYQFPRLNYDYDYQPLIMALKGFQFEANPYPLKDYKESSVRVWHEELESSLMQWAAFPSPVSQTNLEKFLGIVERGLDKEAALIGREYGKYAQRILGRIEEQVKRRNKRIWDYHARTKNRPGSSS